MCVHILACVCGCVSIRMRPCVYVCEYMYTRPSVYISLIPRPSNTFDTFEGLGMRLVCI